MAQLTVGGFVIQEESFLKSKSFVLLNKIPPE